MRPQVVFVGVTARAEGAHALTGIVTVLLNTFPHASVPSYFTVMLPPAHAVNAGVITAGIVPLLRQLPLAPFV